MEGRHLCTPPQSRHLTTRDKCLEILIREKLDSRSIIAYTVSAEGKIDKFMSYLTILPPL